MALPVSEGASGSGWRWSVKWPALMSCSASEQAPARDVVVVVLDARTRCARHNTEAGAPRQFATEPFGNNPARGCLFSIPVVATLAGGIPEIVRADATGVVRRGPNRTGKRAANCSAIRRQGWWLVRANEALRTSLGATPSRIPRETALPPIPPESLQSYGLQEDAANQAKLLKTSIAAPALACCGWHDFCRQ
jgi:hypothetical protein